MPTNPPARPVTETPAAGKRRPYAPPRVLSAEPLEAAAVVCDPPAGGFGKDTSPPLPPPCSTLGS